MRIGQLATGAGFTPRASGSTHWTRTDVDGSSRELGIRSTGDWGCFVALRNNALADRFRRAIKILERASGPDGPQLLSVLQSYEALLRLREEYAEAE